MMTGVGASGFAIKGGVIPCVPALPCVYITNDMNSYENMRNDPAYEYDVVWWKVSTSLFPSYTSTRTKIEID